MEWFDDMYAAIMGGYLPVDGLMGPFYSLLAQNQNLEKMLPSRMI